MRTEIDPNAPLPTEIGYSAIPSLTGGATPPAAPTALASEPPTPADDGFGFLDSPVDEDQAEEDDDEFGDLGSVAPAVTAAPQVPPASSQAPAREPTQQELEVLRARYKTPDDAIRAQWFAQQKIAEQGVEISNLRKGHVQPQGVASPPVGSQFTAPVATAPVASTEPQIPFQLPTRVYNPNDPTIRVSANGFVLNEFGQEEYPVNEYGVRVFTEEYWEARRGQYAEHYKDDPARGAIEYQQEYNREAQRITQETHHRQAALDQAMMPVQTHFGVEYATNEIEARLAKQMPPQVANAVATKVLEEAAAIVGQYRATQKQDPNYVRLMRDPNLLAVIARERFKERLADDSITTMAQQEYQALLASGQLSNNQLPRGNTQRAVTPPPTGVGPTGTNGSGGTLTRGQQRLTKGLMSEEEAIKYSSDDFKFSDW